MEEKHEQCTDWPYRPVISTSSAASDLNRIDLVHFEERSLRSEIELREAYMPRLLRAIQKFYDLVAENASVGCLVHLELPNASEIVNSVPDQSFEIDFLASSNSEIKCEKDIF